MNILVCSNLFVIVVTFVFSFDSLLVGYVIILPIPYCGLIRLCWTFSLGRFKEKVLSQILKETRLYLSIRLYKEFIGGHHYIGHCNLRCKLHIRLDSNVLFYINVFPSTYN